MSEQAKKWMHWCDACHAHVAHVTGHGVEENAALLRRAEQAERLHAEANRVRTGLAMKLDEAERAAIQNADELTECRGALAEAKEEIASLRADWQTYLDTPQDVVATLRATLARVEEERTDAQARMVKFSEDAVRAFTERDGLKETLARVEGERNKALRDLKWYEDVLHTVTAERDELRSKNDGLRAALAEKQVQLDRVVGVNAWIGVEPAEGPVVKMSQAQYDALTAERDGLRKENERLAKEHTQCHEWNGKLVHEHYELADRIRVLTAERERHLADFKAEVQAAHELIDALIAERDALRAEADGLRAALKRVAKREHAGWHDLSKTVETCENFSCTEYRAALGRQASEP